MPDRRSMAGTRPIVSAFSLIIHAGPPQKDTCFFACQISSFALLVGLQHLMGYTSFKGGKGEEGVGLSAPGLFVPHYYLAHGVTCYTVVQLFSRPIQQGAVGGCSIEWC